MSEFLYSFSFGLVRLACVGLTRRRQSEAKGRGPLGVHVQVPASGV